MKKFESVDVIASLEAIMRLNTVHYQSDFKYDIDAIRKSADSLNPDDQILLWMSRPAGTWCFRERNVFLRESEAFITWDCYRGSQDDILAYTVEITGQSDGKVTGHLYELEYQAHVARITKAALPADQVTVTFQDGQTRRFDYPEYNERWHSIEKRYGEITAIQYEPASADELQNLLRAEHDSRAKLPCGELKDHLRALADDKIFAEARRLNDELQKLDAPNSPDRMHFMAQLFPDFCLRANTLGIDGLFHYLPYKSLTICGLDEPKGAYAMISRGENRVRQLRRRPSVKKQLQTAREAAPSAPKINRPTEMER